MKTKFKIAKNLTFHKLQNKSSSINLLYGIQIKLKLDYLLMRFNRLSFNSFIKILMAICLYKIDR